MSWKLRQRINGGWRWEPRVDLYLDILHMLTLGPYTSVRKLNAGNLTPWQHHRGGWKFVCGLIAQYLHCEDGVRFIGSVEDEVAERRIIAEPWVGFIHQVPKHNIRWFPDLERLLRDEYWKASAQNCLGLFVLSSYVKDYLQSAGCAIPIARLFYPAEPVHRPFSIERFLARYPRRIVSGGEFLRNFQPYYDLKAPGFSKQLLVHDGFKWESIVKNESVAQLGRVTDDDYDSLLEDSVLFLNLFDAPANTTVVECIARNTPLLINRLPGVVEYLGEDYPFYYSSIDEAEAKLQQPALIQETSQYLSSSPMKAALTGESFLAALQNSAIYRSLPVPVSQLKHYDVSVVICSYKRVYNMDALLQAFVNQSFAGRFEVIIWNNNYEARQDIDLLFGKYKGTIDLKVIHSTENFYCVIRLAMASLIRSELLLICDDDVKPSPGYITTFMEKAQEYGPNSVLCCRGHVFKPHILNEEEPQRFWAEYEDLSFFDESKSDRQVHFFHADNCLIPKKLLQRALAHPMERYEFWLIDDYWLSFVFSHVLNVPIWKIKATEAFSFTECADDPKIALYHDPKVIEQRINFYVHHMRLGWPFPIQARRIGEKVGRVLSPGPEKNVCWNSGFGGINMFSEADDADFERAREAGITVVRFGGVGDAQDFRYLVDENGEQSAVCGETLNRLAAGIQRAANHGIKVIISLGHVPGRVFALESEQYDFRLWSTAEYCDRFIALWSKLAKYLRHFRNVVGYDLLNEPFTPDDVAQGYFDEMPATYAGTLNHLYERTIAAIREWDSQTRIILESTYWASPRTLQFLRTYDDPGIVYSFHMYAPPAYTMRALNRSRFAYPGLVKNWPDSKWGGSIHWDKKTIRNLLGEVKDWQIKHRIPDQNIFVGECGVCREATGAQRYLVDVLNLLAEFRWSWAVFAFRDSEWDAMNYELGTDPQNMLPTGQSEFFTCLKSYFK
jgi:glycosyltransferase involved in cell wall biosynthesis